MLEIILAYRAGFDKIFQALGVCASQLGAFLVLAYRRNPVEVLRVAVSGDSL